MLIRDCKINITSNPEHATMENLSSQSLTLYKPLKKIVKIIKIITKHVIIPYSSAMTGNIKSVCASGIFFLIVPSPGPFPKYPPAW